MTAIEILRAAREKLAQPGVWAKNSVDAMSEGRCCVGLAICSRNGAPEHARRSACAAFKLTIEANGSDAVMRWNDAPERTLNEVLAAFDRAIALAESFNG
jgi:hypothetical protein